MVGTKVLETRQNSTLPINPPFLTTQRLYNEETVHLSICDSVIIS